MISAPGKLFLVGEYGVLAGGAAVVAAVDRRAIGRFVPGAAAATLVVTAAANVARAHLEHKGATVPVGAPEIDSTALSAGAHKLGLGSSAAVAAVAVGALLDAAGCDLDAERDAVFALADDAHRAAQGGRGSGADVAAAVFGGVIAFRRAAGAAPVVRALPPAPSITVVVFAAGAPRATVDGIRAVEALAARDPARYGARMREIAAAADDFLLAWEADDARAVVDAARSAGGALAALGHSAEIDIWTDPARAAERLAHELGGAAKPSGAGGGDVGVAFLTSPGAVETFRRRAPHIGIEILSITTGAGGLRRESSARERNHVER